jgi:hypothetical protein
MSLENSIQELTAAVQDLTRAIIRDSVVRTDIWRESTREALRIFPLSQAEIDELTGKTSPDRPAEPEPVPESDPEPSPEPVVAADPEVTPEPGASPPSPEDVMALGRQLVATGMKAALGNILTEIGGKQVKGLDDRQRTEFARLASAALAHNPDQADAA